jgi:hypothetical protein
LGRMARYNGLTAMDMRQHVGASHSPRPLQQQFVSQVTNSNENLLSPHANPSPSASIDLSTLNPSFSSNITSDFASSYFDSTSQNSFGRNVGSATLIPLSQSQTVPPKGMVNSGVIPDEWSGTTITGPGTPSTQHQQQPALQSPPVQIPAAQGVPQSKQQYLYDGRIASSSLQGLGNNQYQAVLSTSQQSGGYQGGSRDGLQSFPSGAQGGSSSISQQVPLNGQQGDVQPMDITVVKQEYPSVLKAPKTEYTGMEGVKSEYPQEALTPSALLRASEDSAYQEGSFHGPTSSNQVPGFDGGPTSSQQSGLEGDTSANHLGPHQSQLAGMNQSGSFQGAQTSSLWSVIVNGST